MMRWRLMMTYVANLAAITGCVGQDAEPCKPRNHCRRLADGSVACEPGYTWRNSADPNDLICVPAVPDCSACTPPSAWCRDALTLVTHTTVGCVDDSCAFVPQETRCALGCDEASAACVGCANACSSPGAAQCHDGRVRACAADSNGCLAWDSFILCGDGICASVDSCAGCAHDCAATGTRECADGRVRHCVLDADGCRRWTDFLPCGTGACRDLLDCMPPPSPGVASSCSVDDWCWVHPRPTGNRLAGVWGIGPIVWVVGDGGTLMRWDGLAWSHEPARSNGALHGVFGASLNHVWAVGDGGVIWRYDGENWRSEPSPTGANLYAGWCAAADDCWAVGDAIGLHWQGSSWSPVALPAGALSLYDVWGRRSDDVWAVGYGYGGALLHWDGQSWQSRPSGLSAWVRFARVWGDGAGEVWAVHDSGPAGLWRWRGTAWEPVSFGGEGTARAVWGRGAEVWVASDGGLRRWDGSQWQAAGGFASTTILDLWAVDTGPFWAAGDGGTVIAFDGGWQVRAGLPGAARHDYGAVWGTAGQIWAVGSELGHFDGVTWTTTPLPAIGNTSYQLTGIWGNAAVRWAVGDNGAVLRDIGGGWRLHSQHSGGLRGVWAAGDDVVWAVADDGVVHHWDGAAWQSQALAGGAVGLWAIHGSSADHVIAVGEDASVFCFDGLAWSPMHGVSEGDWLTAVWTSGVETWAGGRDGVFYRWSGGEWVSSASGTGQWIRAIWGVSSQEIWAVTTSPAGRGTLLRYDGERWTAQVSHAGERLLGLWGSAAGEMWAVGAGSAVLRHVPGP